MSGIAALSLLIGIVTAAFLVTHRFETIERTSVFKYLVDTEIRQVPLKSGDIILTYDTFPVDGTSSAVDAIRIRTTNKAQTKQGIVDYLGSIGYHREDGYTFRKGDNKITIDDIDNGIEVSKYSWD